MMELGRYRLLIAQVANFLATALVLVGVTATVFVVVPLEPISAGDLDTISSRTAGINEALLRMFEEAARSERNVAPVVVGSSEDVNRFQSAQIAELQSKLGRIEAAIMTDPSKALELPLVRRDIETVRTQMKEGLEAVRSETARAYDLMKLLVAMMAAVSLSLVGMAAAGLWRSTREGSPGPRAALVDPPSETTPSTRLADLEAEADRRARSRGRNQAPRSTDVASDPPETEGKQRPGD